MCLHASLTEKRKNKILNTIPPKGLKVYKVVKILKGDSTRKDRYVPPYQHVDVYGDYLPGENDAKSSSTVKMAIQKNTQYKTGFHFFKTRYAAEGLKKFFDENRSRETNSGQEIIYEVLECIIKKEWITEIGRELSRISWSLRNKVIVFVAKKAIFPDFLNE